MVGPPSLLHGLLPGDGPLAVAVDILAFGALLFTALALVLVSEDGTLSRRRKLLVGAVVLLVPVLGPAVYLWRRSRAGSA